MAGPGDGANLPTRSDGSEDDARGPQQTSPQIEGYEVLGPLGEGGMGVVWRAVQLSTRRPVALNGELVADMDVSKWTEAGRNPDGSKTYGFLGRTPLAERPTKGMIGLQGAHRGAARVFYRNLRIKECAP